MSTHKQWGCCGDIVVAVVVAEAGAAVLSTFYVLILEVKPIFQTVFLSMFCSSCHDSATTAERNVHDFLVTCGMFSVNSVSGRR